MSAIQSFGLIPKEGRRALCTTRLDSWTPHSSKPGSYTLVLSRLYCAMPSPIRSLEPPRWPVLRVASMNDWYPGEVQTLVAVVDNRHFPYSSPYRTSDSSANSERLKGCRQLRAFATHTAMDLCVLPPTPVINTRWCFSFRAT